MSSKFYLCASGNEKDIRNLYESLNLSGSEMKPLLTKHSAGKDHQENQWIWYTPYHECTSYFPEDELSKYLQDNQNLINKLKEHRDVLHELSGIIVSQPDAGEKIRGYSISSDLMRLLSIAKISLEIGFE